VYAEEDFLPISGLQHMAFCERRWALVHLESQWAENRFTSEGKILHERAHSGEIESRPGVLIRRALRIHSFRLGLSGQTDVVEFYPAGEEGLGVSVEGQKGLWRPYPIEYKRSRDKAGSLAYRIQLCAQAMCLEEMLSTEIPEGAVYDRSSRHRQAVEFDTGLRSQVEQLGAYMHELYVSRITPRAGYEKKCDSCSLYSICLPKSTGTCSAQRYLRRAVANAMADPAANPEDLSG
jgi:CRISPR-associated exonuclease Cas4